METIGIFAAIGLLLIAALEAALALGAPWGRAAWGGGSDRLPTRLRVASGVAAIVWVFAALVVLERVGFDVPLVSSDLAEVAIWVVAGVLVLGTVVNLASRSRLERAIWAPASLVLAILTILVATSEMPAD